MFKDMEAIGKVPPAHGINSVHLVQGEMTADYSAIPLSMFYLLSSTACKKHNLSTPQGRRQAIRKSDGNRSSKQERVKCREMSRNEGMMRRVKSSQVTSTWWCGWGLNVAPLPSDVTINHGYLLGSCATLEQR